MKKYFWKIFEDQDGIAEKNMVHREDRTGIFCFLFLERDRMNIGGDLREGNKMKNPMVKTWRKWNNFIPE